ncbi:hypothetical protein BT63DRAFT_421344 [Microthyrium microscopicum]|uniref:Uncharacterized protein n=1 Tax=Microthyrium microscopicum TaxID=703497 RepID=A0A6A6UNX8_9PEZI|nr:hypothetical protein BT63DRAFT_421344 [Microthyrium microscopicum]
MLNRSPPTPSSLVQLCISCSCQQQTPACPYLTPPNYSCLLARTSAMDRPARLKSLSSR